MQLMRDIKNCFLLASLLTSNLLTNKDKRVSFRNKKSKEKDNSKR